MICEEEPLGLVLPTLRCSCGADRIVAVAPGTKAETTDLFTLTRGVPMQAWCITCWPALKKEGAAE